jgi:FK506-binding protein 1
MSLGEIARLTLPPEYAYGVSGYPPVIPESATLIFEIELLAFS